jgi:hypothetical protein
LGEIDHREEVKDMDVMEMVETAFAADFSEGPVDCHARACVLATVLAHHPSGYTVPRLSARVRTLVGEVPAEKAVVDLDRTGALRISEGVVRPTDAALSLLGEAPGPPGRRLRETLAQLRVQH